MSIPIRRPTGNYKPKAFSDDAAKAATARRMTDTTINARKWCVEHKETGLFLCTEPPKQGEPEIDTYVIARHQATGFETRKAAIEAADRFGLTGKLYGISQPLEK